MTREYKYQSVFKEDIKQLLKEKSVIFANSTIHNYKVYLKEFDLWCIDNNINNNHLSKELIENWMLPCKKQNNLTRHLKSVITRELAKSIIKNDRQAYVIPTKYYKAENEHIPYIYTNKEIRDFLKAAENLKNTNWHPYMKETYSLIFKLLIYTGTRKSEILNLKVKDINFIDNGINIVSGKEYIDRFIPLTDELMKEIKNYYQLLLKYGNQESYFFYNVCKNTGKRNRICDSSLKEMFHNFLKEANIEYKGLKEGPRIHDFRYTFTVKSIKKLIENKKDLNVYLQRLSKYLGHSNLQDTLYYYRPIEAIYNQDNYKTNKLIPNIVKGDFYDE